MSARPKRIQRKRTKSWRKPEGAVYVGRPTKWGNPYIAVESGRAGGVWLYEEDLLSGRLHFTVEDVKREMRGKDLMCWCKLGDLCHADVLLRVANSTE